MIILANEKTAVPETTFPKEKLLTAKQFKGREDILGALLEDKKEYSVSEAQKKIDSYMKGKVI